MPQNKENPVIEFVKILSSAEHIAMSYQLLQRRQYAISHQSLPTLSEHEDFVKTHPYRHWFFVKIRANFVGTIYIHKDNSIGLHIAEESYPEIELVLRQLLEEFEPLPPIKSVRSRLFHLHIPIKDDNMASALVNFGAVAIQRTFALVDGSDIQY